MFQHGHVAPELHLLEGAGQPHGGGLVGLLADEFLVVKTHRPLSRAINAGDQIEDGGLSGPIGADQAGNLSRVQAEIVS